MLPRPPNSCVTGAMKLSPIRMFLSSSFTSSYPGGRTTSTTYLPAGSIGRAVVQVCGRRHGSAVQIVQFVPVGLAGAWIRRRHAGELYIPSYGAG